MFFFLLLLPIITLILHTLPTAVHSTQPPQPPQPPQPLTVLNVTDSPCFVPNDGHSDATKSLQACVTLSFTFEPPLPMFFPLGTYLLSDTIHIVQPNPWTDDGINVVPCRFLPYTLFGSTLALPRRPLIKLADNSSGFNNPQSPKAVFSLGGGGVNMNNLVRGLDFDLTGSNLNGAVGISHAGERGVVYHLHFTHISSTPKVPKVPQSLM